MSDFFTHLAARTLAPPTLRPRTLSRFESAQTADAGESWSEDATAPRTNVRQVASAAAQPATTPSGSRPDAIERETIRERTRDVIHEATTHVVREAGEDRVETHEVRVLARDTPRERRADPEVQKGAIDTTASPRIEERDSETRIEVHRRELVPQPMPERATARAHREVVAAPAASEPVIHVSIGRVEVRAVTQSAPQRSPRRDTTMTIDDYVARKNAKERR
jgi:hypothetical protein